MAHICAFRLNFRPTPTPFFRNEAEGKIKTTTLHGTVTFVLVVPYHQAAVSGVYLIFILFKCGNYLLLMKHLVVVALFVCYVAVREDYAIIFNL
jgi:hypothetical protein